jgi:hypothetical protein
MVASMLRKGHVQTGVRRFDPQRDLQAVAELIGIAFGDGLDPAGRVALADMRRVARWTRRRALFGLRKDVWWVTFLCDGRQNGAGSSSAT